MFTGIIEQIGTVINVEEKGENKALRIGSAFSSELSVDQSVSHNGVCLTVTDVESDGHSVVAVRETLQRSNLDRLKVGDKVNLERSMPNKGRFDGHIVQGHVDQTAVCKDITEADGSWEIQFELDHGHEGLVIEKGSICVNGISLTCFGISDRLFKVAIIPYTYENTNLDGITKGVTVNIEFDIVGKYIRSLMSKNL